MASFLTGLASGLSGASNAMYQNAMRKRVEGRPLRELGLSQEDPWARAGLTTQDIPFELLQALFEDIDAQKQYGELMASGVPDIGRQMFELRQTQWPNWQTSGYDQYMQQIGSPYEYNPMASRQRALARRGG